LKWQKAGLSKTQAVVPELISRMEDSGRNHAIWMDNLFTSANMLGILLEMGIRGARTVRTSHMRREIMEEKDLEDQLQAVNLDDVAIQNSSQKTSNPLKKSKIRIDSRLQDLKTKYTKYLNWGDKYAVTTSDKKVLQVAWRDAQVVLFMTTINRL
jgi:hypothetical protein